MSYFSPTGTSRYDSLTTDRAMRPSMHRRTSPGPSPRDPHADLLHYQQQAASQHRGGSSSLYSTSAARASPPASTIVSHSRVSLDRPDYNASSPHYHRQTLTSPSGRTSGAYDAHQEHLYHRPEATHTALTYYSPAPTEDGYFGTTRHVSPGREVSPVRMHTLIQPSKSSSVAAPSTPMLADPMMGSSASHDEVVASSLSSAPHLAASSATAATSMVAKEQLDQAVSAHKSLMVEYQKKNDELAMLNGEMTEMAKECNELNDAVEKIKVDHAEQLASKERVEKKLRQQVELLEAERDQLLDRVHLFTKDTIQQRLQDDSTAASKEGESTVLRQRIALLEEKHDEAVKTALRLTEELEDAKKLAVEAKSQHSQDMQKVLRDALSSNENAVATVSTELVRSHEAATRLLEQERQALKDQLAEATRENAALRDQHEIALKREVDQNEAQRQSIESLVKQRDDLLSEAKFQMEIVSDHQQEKASMRAEITTLRAVVASLGTQAAHRGTNNPNDIGLPSRVSTANVSHALSPTKDASGEMPSPSSPQPNNSDAVSPSLTTSIKAPSREELYQIQADKRENENLKEQVKGLSEELSKLLASCNEKEHALVVLRGELVAERAMNATRSSQPTADASLDAAASAREEQPKTTASANNEEVEALLKAQQKESEDAQNTLKKYIAELEQRVASLQIDVEQCKKELEETTAERDAGLAQIAELQAASSPTLEQPALGDVPSGRQTSAIHRSEDLEVQELKKKLNNAEEELEEERQMLQSTNFEINELRKQLQSARERLRLRDADLEEQQRNYAELENKLTVEREYGDKARQDVEEVEKKLQDQAKELGQRIDTLNKELNTATKKHGILVEQADAAEIAMADMEQTLADALFALQQQSNLANVGEEVQSRQASSYALQDLPNTPTSLSLAASKTPPRRHSLPPAASSTTDEQSVPAVTTAPTAERGAAEEPPRERRASLTSPASPTQLNSTFAGKPEEVSTPPPQQPVPEEEAPRSSEQQHEHSSAPHDPQALDTAEGEKLLSDVSSDPNAMRLIGAIQRRRLSSKKK